jgi:hypothetical protein
MEQAERCWGRDGNLSVASTLVIAELNLDHPIIEVLDHGPHLTPNETVLAIVGQQRDRVEEVDGRSHWVTRVFQYSGRRRP